ncbi:MAG: hypothetical protein KY055_01005 [Candidatus Nealsonbacteria bacterium]|nr:hypothetical protein [Candidatus Nealsonbacteria bacterium]
MKINFQKGLTVIEILLTILIFTVVLTGVFNLFVTAIREQRRNLASQELLSQTGFLLEYMSRSIRMARKDLTGHCIAIRNNYEVIPGGIRFLNHEHRCQEFFLSGTQINKRKSTDHRAINFGSPLPLTSPRLTVAAFRIGPSFGWSQADTIQPRVTFFLDIKGPIPVGAERPEIMIQTSLSQRQLDVKR